MISVYFSLIILLNICFVLPKDLNDTSFAGLSIYYDPVSGQKLRITSIENVFSSANFPATKINLGKIPGKIIKKIGFRSNGCTCQNLVCGCCLGIKLQQLNFNREGCMNFTYDPNEFAIEMDMYMNDDVIFSNSFSGKNPPPLCLPVPIPYIPIELETCARVYNIYTPGQNIHMCLDFETKVQKATLLVLHFDCMRLGTNGLALVKPGEENAGLPTSTEIDIDGDIYDDVTEIKYTKNNDMEM